MLQLKCLPKYITTSSHRCLNLSARLHEPQPVKKDQLPKERITRQKNVKNLKPEIKIRGKVFKTDPSQYNLTDNLLILAERGGMHNDIYHPVGLLSKCIEQHFKSLGSSFEFFTNLHPVVSTHQQFDSMLIPIDHVSRSKTDNYYINKNTVLRAHTSAHQEELMKAGHSKFLVFGDVYRRDEIDSTHYPAFHQLEGVKLFTKQELQVASASSDEQNLIRTKETQSNYSINTTEFLINDMKSTIESLIIALLGCPKSSLKWSPDYFPFTHPSYELEILYNDKWVEILGCGVIEQEILDNCGATTTASGQKGWAFGIGIERLAMLMFKVKDIRMLWTKDEQLVKSYNNLIKNLYLDMGIDVEELELANRNEAKTLTLDLSKVKNLQMPQNYTKTPALTQNLSFFKVDPAISPNDVYDIIRDVAGELIESVTIKSSFFHPKKKLESDTFELIFRPTGAKNMSHNEVNVITLEIKKRLLEELDIIKRW